MPNRNPFLVVLGIAQDAGYPQAGCRGDCCTPAWKNPRLRRRPCCVAVVDPETNQGWMIDCTPHFPEQLSALEEFGSPNKSLDLAGVFLTHAHIGHYAGLIHLGREAMDARDVAVYVLPRMETFLQANAPWSQLVDLKNIALHEIAAGQSIKVTENLSFTPLLVPHRGEFSETAAYAIQGPHRSVLYLSDIEDWEAWDDKIESIVESVDYAYLDGTFYSQDELPCRDMKTVRHPLIADSIERFAALPVSERNKIRFLHLNHTNPALQTGSDANHAIQEAGHHVAQQGERMEL